MEEEVTFKKWGGKLLDDGGHGSKAVPEDPDKTVAVPSSPNVAVSVDRKWKMAQKQTKERKKLQTVPVWLISHW